MDDDRFEQMTADEIIEEGVGLVARGLFRKAKSEGHKEAAGSASSVLNVVRGMWLDFERNAARPSA
jgi:hypothetical protein